MQDTPEFKVGDRVKIISAKLFDRKFLGKEGVFDGKKKGTVFGAAINIIFDDGTEDYGWPSEIELVIPAPPAPTTSGPYMAQHNADGTLTLTPVQEAEEREHKPGEVWREPNGDLYLVTHGYATTGEYLTVQLTGERCAHISELEETEDDESDDTFAYPSLAAAVAAGEIK